MTVLKRILLMATASPRVTVNGRHDYQQENARVDRAVGEQRQGEELLSSWVNGLYLDALNARQKTLPTNVWRDWERGYWGDYWPEILPSWKSPIQVNEMKRLILTELSDLTDNSPTVYVTSNPVTGAREEQVEDEEPPGEERFLELMKETLDAREQEDSEGYHRDHRGCNDPSGQLSPMKFARHPSNIGGYPGAGDFGLATED